MRLAPILCLLALAACTGNNEAAAVNAERQYEIVKSSSPAEGELCRAAKGAAAAWLKAENVEKYQEWQGRTLADCPIVVIPG